MNDRYKRFTPHEDNVEEIISSDHVNELQSGIEKNQEELYRQDDIDFLDRTLFVLENHTVVNSMFVDLIEDVTKLNIEESPNIQFNPEERTYSITTATDENGNTIDQAEFNMIPFQNLNNTNMSNIIFMANTYEPPGTRMLYEISNDGESYYSIKPSEANVFVIPTLGSKLYLRITFYGTPEGKTPILKSYAILYRDAKYVTSFSILDKEKAICTDCQENLFEGYSHKDLLDVGPDDHHPQEHAHNGLDGSGLISHTNLLDIGEDDHHPKNHQHGVDGVDLVDLTTDVKGSLGLEHLSYLFTTGEPGELTLIRNPLADDKLVQVIAPDSEVYLVYDWTHEGRLDTVVTIFDAIATIEVLEYGPYTDANGTVKEVMIGTDKSIKDATDADVQAIVANIMAAKPA